MILSLGADSHGRPVTINCANQIVCARIQALPRQGKTTLIKNNIIISILSSNPIARCFILDGKGGGDFRDLGAQFPTRIKVIPVINSADEVSQSRIEQCEGLLAQIRSANELRDEKGISSWWDLWAKDLGTAEHQPIVIVLDEAHLILQKTNKATRPYDKLRNAVCELIEYATEAGGSAGCLTVISTLAAHTTGIELPRNVVSLWVTKGVSQDTLATEIAGGLKKTLSDPILAKQGFWCVSEFGVPRIVRIPWKKTTKS